MNILIAIDSFKGSLTSVEAGNAVKDGILKSGISADIEVIPIADGGEGTLESLTLAAKHTIDNCSTFDPLMRPVNSSYMILSDTNTAVIESANIIGLSLLNENERKIYDASSYGLGHTIMHIISLGYRDFIISLGGSATNDCGIGMLSAMGFKFTYKNGQTAAPNAYGLSLIENISDSDVPPELKQCKFNILTDVRNPLCGENGCSAVFSPQKGASVDEALKMDEWISDFSEKVMKKYPDCDTTAEGDGAAGGLGFAFRTFLNAHVMNGFEYISSAINLEEKITSSDIIVTGEGKMDAQTSMGKLPFGIARLAKKYNKKVIAFCGSADMAEYENIDAVFPILTSPLTLSDAMRREVARRNLSFSSEQVFKLLK